VGRAPRIHGELVKLGYEIAESTVSKCMVLRQGPASQRDRPLRGSRSKLRAAICISRDRPGAATITVVCGDNAPDTGVAGATDRRGIPAGYGTDLLGA
jgi:hypothetical protein